MAVPVPVVMLKSKAREAKRSRREAFFSGEKIPLVKFRDNGQMRRRKRSLVIRELASCRLLSWFRSQDPVHPCNWIRERAGESFEFHSHIDEEETSAGKKCVTASDHLSRRWFQRFLLRNIHIHKHCDTLSHAACHTKRCRQKVKRFFFSRMKRWCKRCKRTGTAARDELTSCSSFTLTFVYEMQEWRNKKRADAQQRVVAAAGDSASLISFSLPFVQSITPCPSSHRDRVQRRYVNHNSSSSVMSLTFLSDLTCLLSLFHLISNSCSLTFDENLLFLPHHIPHKIATKRGIFDATPPACRCLSSWIFLRPDPLKPNSKEIKDAVPESVWCTQSAV